MKDVLEFIVGQTVSMSSNLSIQKAVADKQYCLCFGLETVNTENLSQTLEVIGLKNNSNLNAMFRLESGKWPSTKDQIQ